MKAQVHKSVRKKLTTQDKSDIESLHDQAFKPLRPLLDDLVIRPGTNPAFWPLLAHSSDNIFPGLSIAAMKCGEHAGVTVPDLCENLSGRLPTRSCTRYEA